MKFNSIIAATAAMLVSAASLSAQTTLDCTGSGSAILAGCQVTNTVTSAVPYVARLILNNNSTTLAAPTAAAFGTAAGVDNAAALTLEVRSNVGYSITANAAAAMFTGGSGAKPSSSITYTTNASTYKSLVGSGSLLGSGAGATASTTFTVGYKTTYDWIQDTPGSYAMVINYTLTTP